MHLISFSPFFLLPFSRDSSILSLWTPQSPFPSIRSPLFPFSLYFTLRGSLSQNLRRYRPSFPTKFPFLRDYFFHADEYFHYFLSPIYAPIFHAANRAWKRNVVAIDHGREILFRENYFRSKTGHVWAARKRQRRSHVVLNYDARLGRTSRCCTLLEQVVGAVSRPYASAPLEKARDNFPWSHVTRRGRKEGKIEEFHGLAFNSLAAGLFRSARSLNFSQLIWNDSFRHEWNFYILIFYFRKFVGCSSLYCCFEWYFNNNAIMNIFHFSYFSSSYTLHFYFPSLYS